MDYQRKVSKTILHVLAAVLLATTLAATASAQYTVTFFDGTFGPGWIGSVAGHHGHVTFSFATKPTGGYPGAWEEESHTWSGTDAVVFLANFNPINTFTGSFASLSYSYDLEAAPGQGGILYAIAVEQMVAGVPTVYIPNDAGPTIVRLDVVSAGDTWQVAPNPYFTTGLIASQFCRIPSNISYTTPLDCSSHPDFSNPTLPTVFGYAIGNSFIGTKTVTEHSGIDNWCVVLNNASAPGGSGRGCGGVPNP